MQHLSDNKSDRIKEKIKETGIKQVHLANKLGISPQHLNKILAKNQEGSRYLPRIEAILGMQENQAEQDEFIKIPILAAEDLISLADESIQFDELVSVMFQSWSGNLPQEHNENHNFFGFQLLEALNSRILKEDLLIFSSNIAQDLTGHIGIAFIKAQSCIVVGKLKNNGQSHGPSITLYNESLCVDLTPEDRLLGVAILLERKLKNLE